ncbi:hypothetical protein [Lacrimispora algidixylanolytica]|uniref:hypothetical protein n=1 Tax=Lacrimispora algidixylanolytica TaxID=94868 RepID=UPI0013148779|nr:hypothetical protein [Lacrimispora algidixylanolytica]
MGFLTNLLISSGFASGFLEPSSKPKDLDAMTRDNLSGKFTKAEMLRRVNMGYYDKKY